MLGGELNNSVELATGIYSNESKNARSKLLIGNNNEIKKDEYISQEKCHLQDLDINCLKKRFHACYSRIGEKIRRKIFDRLSRRQLKFLSGRASYRKLLLQSIMRRVELEMGSVLETIASILGKVYSKRLPLGSELSKMEKHRRRFLRLENLYRKNSDLENTFKADEENIKQLLAFSLFSSYCKELNFCCVA